MIRYEQVPNEDPKALPNVKVVTDDANAEMAALEETFQEASATEMESYSVIQNTKERNSEGAFVFTIPADEVSDFSDIVWGIDNGRLEELLDRWNQARIDAASDE